MRTQLVALGLAASVVPLLVLLLVVFGVEEEDESVRTGDGGVDVVADSGVSPWIPGAALVLSLASVGLVWLWAKRAVDPIEQMTSLTDDIQAGSLDRRLELDGAPTEIRELGASFDRMLDRLAASSSLERQLIEEASHDLRTPLAALAARLEVAGKRSDPDEIAADLDRCQADVDRLRSTLDLLLVSSRTRQSELEQVDNDLVAVVARVVERQLLLTPDVSIVVEAPLSLTIGVDGASVERAVANLVTNAVEHGGGAPVDIEVRTLNNAVELVVTDEGPGIDAERLPHIFDRYAGDHHGLGLALVKQVADVYGEVNAESPVDGRNGTRVTLRLRSTERFDERFGQERGRPASPNSRVE
ncbi:MAG: HAMP domain-containing sensor histidine kinase [Actinomycetota bacterium]